MIWTEAAPTSEGEPIFVAFRKTFALDAQPKAAELRIFADLRYQLWVNGRYVVRGPVRFDPKAPQFDVVDLASYLQPGANTLAVLVLGRANNNAMMRHVPGLAAELRLTDASGKVRLVKTDESWRWNDKTAYKRPCSNTTRALGAIGWTPAFSATNGPRLPLMTRSGALRKKLTAPHGDRCNPAPSPRSPRPRCPPRRSDPRSIPCRSPPVKPSSSMRAK